MATTKTWKYVHNGDDQHGQIGNRVYHDVLREGIIEAFTHDGDIVVRYPDGNSRRSTPGHVKLIDRPSPRPRLRQTPVLLPAPSTAGPAPLPPPPRPYCSLTSESKVIKFSNFGATSLDSATRKPQNACANESKQQSQRENKKRVQGCPG